MGHRSDVEHVMVRNALVMTWKNENSQGQEYAKYNKCVCIPNIMFISLTY